MKKSFEKLKGLVLKDKKILYATLGVVILLIIIFAVVVTAGGGKEEPGDNGTKLANNNSKSEDDSPSSEESTTYPDEIQTKEDGTIVSVVTQSGQTLNLAEAQTEIDAEGNTIFTTQKGDKVILDNKGSVHVTENKTEESTTPTQKVTDTPTQKPTDAPTQKPTDAPTQKPTDAPTQKPTDVPAPTQKPTDAPAPTEKPTEKPTEPPTYYYNGREVSELEYKIQTDKWNEKVPSGSTLEWRTNRWGFYYRLNIPEWNVNGTYYECDEAYVIKETYKGTTIIDARYYWFITYSDNSYCILVKPSNEMNSHNREYLSSLGL